MKKKIIYIFILLVAIILETSIFPVITKIGASPDVIAMAVLAWAVLDGFYLFLGWAIFAGILYDLAAYFPIGTHAIIFLLITYLVSFFSRRFSVEVRGVGLLLFFMLVVASTFISKIIVAFGRAWEMQNFDGFWNSFNNWESFILQITYNLFLFFLWFLVIKKTKKFFVLEK